LSTEFYEAVDTDKGSCSDVQITVQTTNSSTK